MPFPPAEMLLLLILGTGIGWLIGSRMPMTPMRRGGSVSPAKPTAPPAGKSPEPPPPGRKRPKIYPPWETPWHPLHVSNWDEFAKAMGAGAEPEGGALPIDECGALAARDAARVERNPPRLPRCKTCRHFGARREECQHPRNVQNYRADGHVWEMLFCPPLPGFGCTLHEPKEEA